MYLYVRYRQGWVLILLHPVLQTHKHLPTYEWFFLQCDKLEKIAVIFAPHTYLLLRNPSLWFMVHSRKVRKTVKREAKPERGRVEFETRKLAFPWILICIPKSAFLSTYLYVKCSEKGFASNPGIIYGGCASSIVNFYLVKNLIMNSSIKR